jgi:hypothetical protein
MAPGRGRLPGGCVAGETRTVDLTPADPPVAAARLWAGLDKAWQEAFGQAWEVERLAAMDVVGGLGHLWPRLQELTKALPA